VPGEVKRNYFQKGWETMAKSTLDDKRILAIDDERDILDVLQEEILETCSNVQLDKATSYETAVELLKSKPYDLVILDIMGVRGFDLLDLAVSLNLRVAMLTAHSFDPESLKHSYVRRARAYLPKEKLGEIVPFLEDVLKYEFEPGWVRLLWELRDYLVKRWGGYWKKADEKFWKEFDEKSAHIKW
jgi:CheY-like chemotaxis protein